jgi:hypothetical protein
MLFHDKIKFRIDQATKLLAMKALYNIYVPGVNYSNKYEIIVYTHIIQYYNYRLYSLVYNFFKYSNCSVRNGGVFACVG